MNHVDLKAKVIEAWKNQAPIDLEQAKEIAKGILTGKELSDFLTWMDRFGQQALERAGCV